MIEGRDAAERVELFDRQGFVLMRDALSAERVTELNGVIDRIVAEQPPAEGYNVTNAVERDPAIARLMEEAGALDLVVNHLGYNLQLHSSLLSIRRPVGPEQAGIRRGRGTGGRVSLDWHRDGPSPQFPRVEAFSAKVAYILSDMSAPGRGNTKVIPGSHRRSEFRPSDGNPRLEPPGTVEVLGRPGDAFAFTQNLWHAAGPNLSQVERRLIFIGYCFCWARPLHDLADPQALLQDASPIRRQLVGDVGHKYMPTDELLPLKAYWRGPGAVNVYA